MQIPDRIEWNQLSYDQQVAIARDLAQQLPPAFEFSDVHTFSMGNITQRVAQFSANGTTEFSLIPGGEITLGFNGRNWQPNPDESESWADTAEEYGIPGSLLEYLDKATTPCRQVSLSPFLIETTASEIGWKPLGLDDPDVRELLKRTPRDSRKSRSWTGMVRENRKIRVTYDGSGNVNAEIAEQLTHESLVSSLQKQGFRFPNSDEWEYVCGAGATTLFRWGDHIPGDFYPIDLAPTDMTLSHHRQPNAFGIFIAENPYKCEIVADPNTTRGGDGGSAICGVAGVFLGWLPLATAYFEKHACIIHHERGIDVGYTIGRRVCSLHYL